MDLYCLTFIQKLFMLQHILLELILKQWQFYSYIDDRKYQNNISFIEFMCVERKTRK
jgi:hypothetical protein